MWCGNSKTFLDPKFHLDQQNFWKQNFLGTPLFSDKIFFLTKLFFKHNFFLDPEFWSSKKNFKYKIFFGSNFFWTIFFNQKFFFEPKFLFNKTFFLNQNSFSDLYRPKFCFRTQGLEILKMRQGIKLFQAEHFQLKSCSQLFFSRKE